MREREEDILGGMLVFLGARLAKVIESATDETALREFACAVARLALADSDSVDPRSTNAVEVAERYAQGEAMIEELDRAFELSEVVAREEEEKAAFALGDFEAGVISEEAHKRAHAVHGAAQSANGCAHRLARLAAAVALYYGKQACDTKKFLTTRDEFKRILSRLH